MGNDQDKLEGKVAIFEIDLLNMQTYGNYRSMLDRSIQNNRELFFSNIRYMLTLAHFFNQIDALDQYMFIGGIGVLGNVVNYIGEERIFDFRDIHDIDIVLRSKEYCSLIIDFFDHLDNSSKSLSIKNKSSVRGYSIDAEERRLDSTNLDVYLPNGRPTAGTSINGLCLGEEQWNKKKISSLFGIPISCADPLTLLSMKLSIHSGNKNKRRKKDYEDITNLVGVLDRECYPLERLCTVLPPLQWTILQNIFKDEKTVCEDLSINSFKYLTPPSECYTREILSFERGTIQ